MYNLTRKEAQRLINKWLWNNRYWHLFDTSFRKDIVDCSSLPRIGGYWTFTKFSADDVHQFCETELKKFCIELEIERLNKQSESMARLHYAA